MCCGDDDDPLRPSARESARVLAHSRKTWHSLLSSARLTSQFPSSCCGIDALLNRAPAVPGTSDATESLARNIIYMEGYSQWRIRSTKDCDLTSEFKKSRSQRIQIGLPQPTFCRLSSKYFSTWTGFDALPDAPATGNYLCIFVLGWSYVLSARLLELRKDSEKDKVSYTDNKASLGITNQATPNHSYVISIGNADKRESRWWAAILANGCGWRATFNRLDKEYYPPWTCYLSGDKSFALLHDRPMSTSACPEEPPSSAQAQRYLLRLAQMYNAFDQLLAAFIGALTIPGHIRFGAPVVLPEPRPTGKTGKCTELIYRNMVPSLSEVPHFMSLSCIPNVISSSLFSSFWEPGISCNLVSEWLHEPLREVMPLLVRQEEWRIIIHILATCQPNIAPLWLGSAITGLLPRVFEIYTTFLPPISLEAAVWTSSLQSFMDPAFYRMPKIYRNIRFEQVIPREDEFRLLYITDFESQNYENLPLSPYPPFGTVKLHNTALELQLHVSCGHFLEYSHWVWLGQQRAERQHLDDCGFAPAEVLPPSGFQHGGKMFHNIFRNLSLLPATLLRNPERAQKADFSERLSECATRNLFSWLLFSDGVKLEDKAIWNHEWLSLLLTISEDGSEDSSSSLLSGQISSRSKVVRWLQSIPTSSGNSGFVE